MSPLKLAYSESKIDPDKLADLKALDEKDAAEHIKLEALIAKKIQLGREISDVHEGFNRRDTRRRKILRGEPIYQRLEEAERE